MSDKSFDVRFHFTTNGTVITDSFLTTLSDYSSSFQITIDGNKEKHNKSRFFKKSEKGTYGLIMSNIKKILSIESNQVNIRINYDNETLNDSDTLIKDILALPNENLVVSLHKIWQKEEEEIDYNKIFSFINTLMVNKIIVLYMDLNTSFSRCYADNISQAVINYDRNVFKCTARDFVNNNSEGKLLESGMIQWNTDKLMKRMNILIPKVCEDCKRLPSCPGICSQKIIESNGEVGCTLSVNLPIDDYIIYNFNKYALQNYSNS